MPARDKRVTSYIDRAQPFARPILKHLRKLVHQACPEAGETIKWGFPSFDYKGPFCSMAAFRHHAVFGFWKSKLLKDPDGHLDDRAADGGSAMGNFGRITSLRDLPPDRIIIGFIRQAKKLNDDGVKLPSVPKKPKKKPVVPDYFLAAIKGNPKALSTFRAFSASHQREYVEWITEARTEATRGKRIAQALTWMAAGKPRNWKYMRVR